MPAHEYANGPYRCTVTSREHAVRAKCYGCGVLGVACDFEGGAIDRAEAEGWRTYQGFLFCGPCRQDAQAILDLRDFEDSLRRDTGYES